MSYPMGHSGVPPRFPLQDQILIPPAAEVLLSAVSCQPFSKLLWVKRAYLLKVRHLSSNCWHKGINAQFLYSSPSLGYL